MKTKQIIVTLAGSLAAIVAAAACAVDPEPTPAVAPTGEIAQATDLLTFDTSGIAAAPGAALPAQPLSLTAFATAPLQRGLLRVSETFATTNRVGTRTYSESATWHAEINPMGGQILAVSQTPSGPAVVQSERVLGADAVQRLTAFGVPSAELGPVVQRRSLSLDEQDGTTAATPTVEGYKTFAARGLNGVRVRGHRAVLTYGPDGQFRRALLKWPALAASGHKLRTPLATADIVTRATRALAAEGVTSGAIKLAWVYVPTATPTGEVTLELEVMALVPTDPGLGEGRAVDVAIDAS